MKKNVKKLLLCTMAMVCGMMLMCCTEKTNSVGRNNTEPNSTEAKDEETNKLLSVIYSHEWQTTGDKSLLVCEKNGDFKYYQSAEDMTDNYFDGTYEFYVGADAVDYITSDLKEYDVTEDELEEIFKNNEEYNEENFIILVLNNESCIMDGEEQIDSAYKTPYFGFYLEDDEDLYLDLANMNSSNYITFVTK